MHPACFSCASAASLVDCAAQQRLQPAVMPHLQMALGLLWHRLLTLCLTARSLGSSTCDWLWRGRHGTSRVTRHAPSTVACRGACAAGEAHAVGKNDTLYGGGARPRGAQSPKSGRCPIPYKREPAPRQIFCVRRAWALRVGLAKRASYRARSEATLRAALPCWRATCSSCCSHSGGKRLELSCG